MPVQIDTYVPPLTQPLITNYACYEFALYGITVPSATREAADRKCLDEEICNPSSIIRKYLKMPEYTALPSHLVEDLDSGLFLCAGMEKHPTGKMLPPDHWWLRTNHYIYDTSPAAPLRRVDYIQEVNNCPACYLLSQNLMLAFQNNQIFIGEIPVRLPTVLLPGPVRAIAPDIRRTIINAGPVFWPQAVPPVVVAGGWRSPSA